MSRVAAFHLGDDRSWTGVPSSKAFCRSSTTRIFITFEREGGWRQGRVVPLGHHLDRVARIQRAALPPPEGPERSIPSDFLLMSTATKSSGP